MTPQFKSSLQKHHKATALESRRYCKSWIIKCTLHVLFEWKAYQSVLCISEMPCVYCILNSKAILRILKQTVCSTTSGNTVHVYGRIQRNRLPEKHLPSSYSTACRRPFARKEQLAVRLRCHRFWQDPHNEWRASGRWHYTAMFGCYLQQHRALPSISRW